MSSQRVISKIMTSTLTHEDVAIGIGVDDLEKKLSATSGFRQHNKHAQLLTDHWVRRRLFRHHVQDKFDQRDLVANSVHILANGHEPDNWSNTLHDPPEEVLNYLILRKGDYPTGKPEVKEKKQGSAIPSLAKDRVTVSGRV